MFEEIKVGDVLQQLNRPKLDEYDTVIVAFSGGKDSTACFLHLLDLGVPKEKMSNFGITQLMENQVASPSWTGRLQSYCKNFAEAFNVPIYFSWRHGGFKRELLKENQMVGSR